MNTLLATATYKADKFLDNGLRFMEMTVPQPGKGAGEEPIWVFPNRAAGDSLDCFQPGARLLINGRLYPSRQDYKMYFVPNQQFQLVNEKTLIINKVNLSGVVGFIPPDKKTEDVFAFTLICNAPGQQVLSYRSDDGLLFRLDGWGEDAKRLQKLLHVGRGVSIEGTLRYNTWVNNAGESRSSYQVRIRSGMYQAFGKNKNLVERPDGTPVSGGWKKKEEGTPVDAAPCSVDVPF